MRIAPGRVAAQLDEAGAEHDAEDEPAKEPEDDDGRRALGKRAPVDERAEEDGEEAGFEELDLPTIPIPFLTNINERHV